MAMSVCLYIQVFHFFATSGLEDIFFTDFCAKNSSILMSIWVFCFQTRPLFHLILTLVFSYYPNRISLKISYEFIQNTQTFIRTQKLASIRHDNLLGKKRNLQIKKTVMFSLFIIMDGCSICRPTMK